MSEMAEYDPTEMAKRVYFLRKGGLSFPAIQAQIAESGMEPPAIYELSDLYRKYMVKLAQTYSPDDRQITIQLELERLDDLQNAHWQMAMQADPKSSDVVLKVIAQRVKLLNLDQIDGTDKNAIANVLIVGGEQADFLAALEAGRKPKPVAGSIVDDEEESGGER